MRKKITFIIISILILNNYACKNNKKNKAVILGLETTFKTNSITVLNYNKREIKSSGQLGKTIFRNLEVDTTKVFGIWTQDPTAPFADFYITEKSFHILDFDSEIGLHYMLNKNQISFFYKGNRHTGMITSTENDSLKIKWSDIDFETKYVRFEN